MDIIWTKDKLINAYANKFLLDNWLENITDDKSITVDEVKKVLSNCVRQPKDEELDDIIKMINKLKWEI